MNLQSLDQLDILLLIVVALLLGVIVLLFAVILRQRNRVPVLAAEVEGQQPESPQPISVASSAAPVVSRVDPASNALFATLSHELRTPLNGLLGIAQILQQESPSDDAVAIDGCARHMLAVIGALVNLSKIQSGAGDLPEYRNWVNVHDLMEQVKKDLAFRASLRGLVIELHHQDRSLRLRGDTDHLLSIIENALLGSIESVSLVHIPRTKQVMQVTWCAKASGVTIEIVNPREEFSPNRQEQIQKVFAMTTGSNHARIKMEYLYWAVSLALLERYKGGMSARKNRDGGVHTTLTFSMEQMQASESSELPLGGLRLDKDGKAPKLIALPVRLSVIVAEDDPIARKLMETVLGHMKQDVVFATNGHEVIELIQQSNSCDLILMDIDMPLMDGIATTMALRAGEAGELGKHVPIVAVTAFSSLSDEGKFRRAGMNYFLPKPVKLEKLREVFVDVIRQERKS